MTHRIRITLTDAHYSKLKQESEHAGLGLAELVRRALRTTYGIGDRERAEKVLQKSSGAWTERDLDGAAYVESLRRGTARRLLFPSANDPYTS